MLGVGVGATAVGAPSESMSTVLLDSIVVLVPMSALFRYRLSTDPIDVDPEPAPQTSLDTGSESV